MSRRVVIAAALVLIASGAALLGRDAYIAVKGALAGRLVEGALAAHLVDGDRHRPWDWADFAPVARLEVSRLGLARPVLTGASGESLAFGLGHVDGTANPGAPGHVVLAGHRDSWAAFLGDLRMGDRLRLISHVNKRVYEVVGMQVVGKGDPGCLEGGAGDSLSLLTCYPIASCVPGDQRFVVTCILSQDQG